MGSIAQLLPSLFRRKTAAEFDGTLRDIEAANRWLASHGAGPIPSSVSASSDRPRQIFEIRSDLRLAFPHAYLPHGRRTFLDWLFTHGKTEFGVTNDEIVALLAELDHDPSHGITETYRLTHRWQEAVPNGLLPTVWPKLIRWLRNTEGVSGTWLNAAKPPSVTTRTDGLNLIGHFRLPCGVGEEVVRFAEGLEQFGVPITCRDVPAYHLMPPHSGLRPLGLEDHAISFLKFGAAVDLRAAYERAGLFPKPGVYRVAGWSWELDTFPAEAAQQLDFVDEIWVPSRFVANGVKQIANGKPVRVMTPAIPAPVVPANSRDRFDLDPKAFVILFAFDSGSVFERKNPFALIRAIRIAFRSDDRVTLVLKVSNGDAAPAMMARLKREVAEIGGRVIEGMLPREDVAALLVACDCYASLHRSEGFGFTLAEAMLLGKPTVATNYSGNLDFMTPENSFLISHRLVELDSDIGPYPQGARWAEPDVEHAAELLRYVFVQPEEARAVGLKAKADLELRLSPATAARRIVARLHEIHAFRSKAAA